jgi:hypothetical protein
MTNELYPTGPGFSGTIEAYENWRGQSFRFRMSYRRMIRAHRTWTRWLKHQESKIRDDG